MKNFMLLLFCVFAGVLIVQCAFAADKSVAHGRTVAEVRAAYDKVADPYPRVEGRDVIVPLKIVQSITNYTDSQPVFVCTDLNGWLVRGNKWGEDLRLVATTMVREDNNFRAVGMAGLRFHPCQAKSPNTEKANHATDVNWAQIQDLVSGEYKIANWIDISNGDNKPCILIPKPGVHYMPGIIK
ncbi:MAG: hypothetical protein WCG01_03950 [bacterium]